QVPRPVEVDERLPGAAHVIEHLAYGTMAVGEIEGARDAAVFVVEGLTGRQGRAVSLERLRDLALVEHGVAEPFERAGALGSRFRAAGRRLRQALEQSARLLELGHGLCEVSARPENVAGIAQGQTTRSQEA